MNTFVFAVKFPDGRLKPIKIHHLTQAYAQSELKEKYPDCEVISWQMEREYHNGPYSV